MNILYWHGYLLNGSGSNIFALNVVKDFSKKNRVYLFSQERDNHQEFHEHWTYDRDLHMEKEVFQREAGEGRLIHINPYIGDLLPVFVKDAYEHFQVKTFPELTEEELDTYIDYNVRALSNFIEKHEIDLIFCNHLAISPYILREATKKNKVPYIVIGHGSSLNYTVAVDSRYEELSSLGLRESRGIVFQSEYFYNRSLEVYRDEETKKIIRERGRIVPCGINKDIFGRILSGDELLETIKSKESKGFSREDSSIFQSLGRENSDLSLIRREINAVSSRISSYSAIDSDLHLKLHREKASPVISFVGRMIYSKGPHLFLMTLPYIFSEYPSARIFFIGSGKLRGALEMVLGALKDKNLELLLTFSREGQDLEEGAPFKELSHLKNFITSLIESDEIYSYMDMASRMDLDRITFTGNLSHDILPTFMSYSDLLVVPSIFPESFGMIALEGMYMGNIPVTFDHSGLSEVVPLESNKAPFDERAVKNLRDKIMENCRENVSPDSRRYFRDYAEKFSYENICNMLIDVAQ